jgi:hypothetical protein
MRFFLVINNQYGAKWINIATSPSHIHNLLLLQHAHLGSNFAVSVIKTNRPYYRIVLSFFAVLAAQFVAMLLKNRGERS